MALTRDQIEELRAEMRRPDHRTTSEIARDLGTTKGTVIGALHRAGIKIGRSTHALHDRLEGHRDRIKTLAGLNVSAWAIAREIGCSESTIVSFCKRNEISLHVRVRVPKPQQIAARSSMRGLFGKQRPLSDRDRDEMNRLRDEAIAAGRITRLPPGYAIGAKTFYREEYA